MPEPLTIRNLSSVPLEVKRIERFDPHSGSSNSMKSLHSHFSALTNSIGITNNVTRSVVLQIHPDDKPFASQEVSIPIAPFASLKTDIPAFVKADQERLRLTFDTNGAGQHQMYCPVPTTETGNLQALEPNSPHRFTGIYLPQNSHVTVFASTNLQAWMRELPDPTPLGALSIPGTHNSPTHHKAPPSVRCQAVSPHEQLENGIRFFDIRVHVPSDNFDASSDKLQLVHSVFPISLTGPKYFRDLYTEVRSFLDANPSETLVMSLKREGTGDGKDEMLGRILKSHYTNRQQWFTQPRVPSLGEARGKIVLIRRFNIDEGLQHEWEGTGWGIDAAAWADNTPCATCPSGDVCVQDFYEVMETENVDKKITYCTEQLERSGCCKVEGVSATGIPVREGGGPKLPIYINFLSASNFWKVGTWPEKIAAKVNPSVVEHLCRRHMLNEDGSVKEGSWSTGVVVCDWVGVDGDWDLVRCIVGMNARLITP